MVTRIGTAYNECGLGEELAINIKNSENIPYRPRISAYDFNREGRFNNKTVIARNTDGSVASRFEDSSWDFSASMSATSTSLVMHFDCDEELSIEAKTILTLTMFTPTVSQISLERCFQFYYLIKGISTLCKTEKTTIKKLFSAKGGIHLVKHINDNASYSAQILICLSDYLCFMDTQGGFEHGYKPLGRHALSQLRKVAQAYKANCKQTPVIPSRILKLIYHDTISEFEDLQPVLIELLEMQSKIDTHPMVGCTLSSQQASCNKKYGMSYGASNQTFPTDFELGNIYPLAREYLNQNFSSNKRTRQETSYSFEVRYNRRDVLNAINYIQRVCHDMLIMFTGMRPIEASLLPYFGSRETEVNGVKYWLIYGFAVKARSTNLPIDMWVTNEYGYRAFQTAKRIADLYYKRNLREPLKDMPDGDKTPELSPLYLRDDGKIGKRLGCLKKTHIFSNSYLITKADADELKMIDPHRKWEGEPQFAIGEPFPIQLRMFRRSVAFFASASGVGIVDLKNQLHHLFTSQTFYYAKGSGRANPFLENKDSFASYFNQVRHEAEAFSLINEVINFDGKLFGSSAAYAERNENIYSTIRSEDRPATIRRFKRGELAFTETHVGNCKTIYPCKWKALGSVTACLSCNDADIKPAKLINTIKDQKELVDSLNPDRLEFRTELGELIIMLDFAIKNIERALGKMDRRKREYKQSSQWYKELKKIKKSYSKEVKEHGKVA